MHNVTKGIKVICIFNPLVDYHDYTLLHSDTASYDKVISYSRLCS